MPRKVREKAESGIYHIILRGINAQQIFETTEDQKRFLEILKRYKSTCGFIVYAYCLMGNHIHLLLKEEKEDLSSFMRKIAGQYAYWYNRKYQRCGHLFQDRFRSEPVEDDPYFITVLKYIHQNPVKAGICREASGYPFSSYNEYVGTPELVDPCLALEMIGIDEFIAIHKDDGECRCMESNRSIYVTDENAVKIIQKISKCKNMAAFQSLDKERRNTYIRKIYRQGLSIRQISRLTGVSKKVVENNIH